MNRIKNELTISVGDLYNLEEQSLLIYDFDNDYPNNTHDTWIDQENSFPMPPNINGPGEVPIDKSLVNPRPVNLLSLVKTMNINVSEVKSGNKDSEQRVSDFLKIKFMKNINNYGPVLVPKPSILESKVAPLADMPQPIQLLYGYL